MSEELKAYATTVENCELFRAELAAIKAPARDITAAVDAAMIEMANISPPVRRSECERLIRAALNAVPVRQVSVPDGHSTQDKYEHFLSYSGLSDNSMLRYAYFHGADDGIEPPAAPAADAGIVDMYRHLQKVTPYRFKKIQDASITDGGDVMYFHADRFDSAVIADMAAHRAAQEVE